MNLYLVAYTKIILSVLAIGLVLAASLLAWVKKGIRLKLGRIYSVAVLILAGFCVLAYLNWGAMRTIWGNSDDFTGHFIHHHEMYHFYFGSKYLPELGYDDLYLATVTAMQEDRSPVLNSVQYVRDPMTFDQVWLNQAERQADSVKARFSPERWAAFKSDTALFFSQPKFQTLPLQVLVGDHGNTGSPLWGMISGVFTRGTQPTTMVLWWLQFLDIAVLIAAFYWLKKAFGWRTMGWCLIVFALVPFVFDYWFGSLLRFDWLAAVLIGTSLYQLKKYWAAGFFFAYAVLSRVFPIFFVLALAVKLLADCWQRRSLPQEKYRQFFVGFLVSILALMALSSAYFGSPKLWGQYVERISTTADQKPYGNNYGAQLPLLQTLQQGSQYIRSNFQPIWLDTDQINDLIAGHQLAYWLYLLVLAAGFCLVIIRQDDIGALGFGVSFVFLFQTLNVYYYCMLALFALFWVRDLEKSRRARFTGIGLFVLFMLFYYFEHKNVAMFQGYLTSLWLLLLFGGIALSYLIDVLWDRWVKKYRSVPHTTKIRVSQRP